MGIAESTLYDNHAATGGGAIHNWSSNPGNIVVDLYRVNVTLSGNGAANGAGLYADNAAKGELRNSTIAYSTASSGGGGLCAISGATVASLNTLTGMNT